MRRARHAQLLRAALVAAAMWLLFPEAAYAHDCSFPGDCFGSERAGLAALFGIILSIGLSALPIVGTGKDLWEAITGRDVVTGERLSAWERAINVVAAPLGLIPGLGAVDEAAALPRLGRAVDGVVGASDEAAQVAGRIDDPFDPRLLDVPERPYWRESEDVISRMYPTHRDQVSFRNGQEVPYGTPGSTRPEGYAIGESIEVKNYNVETPAGRSRLVRNVTQQAIERARQLPPGTQQRLIIDVRGQEISNELRQQLVERIVNQSNGALGPYDISIMG